MREIPRMRMPWTILGTVWVLMGLTGRLAAQTRPEPVRPPPSAAEVDAATAGHGPWEYAVGAGFGEDGNIDFLVPKGPSGLAVVPRAGLTRSFRSPRAETRLSAAGRWIGHPNEEGLDRYNGAFSLDGNYRPSLTTRWRAGASYGFGDSDLSGFGETDSSSILVEQGVSLPAVKMRSVAASVGVSRRVSDRTSIRFDSRYYRTAFDSAVLIDGESARSTVGLQRPLGARSTGAVEYSMEFVRSGQRGKFYVTHFGSMQWSRALSVRTAFLLEGGASYTPDVGRAGLDHSASFFGGASFTRQVKRSNFRLVLRREVTPEFGSGVSRDALRGSLDAIVPMGPEWEIRINAGHARPGSAQEAERSSSSSDVFTVLARRVGRHFEVSGEGRYRRRGAFGTLPLVDAFRYGLFLSLLSPSGRAIGPAPGF